MTQPKTLTRRGAIKLCAAGAISSLAGGCGLSNRTASCRIRVTVEVETTQGLKSGSSVWEINAEGPLFYIQGISTRGSVLFGEAIAVDLPGGPIFALRRGAEGSENIISEIVNALLPNTSSGDFDVFFSAVRKLGNVWFSNYSADLPHISNYSDIYKAYRDRPMFINNWPMMVRFRDINVPASVELVDPKAAGVKRIWLETTTDPVTAKLDKILPWLPTYIGSLVRNPQLVPRNSLPIGARITDADFSFGARK